MNREFYEKIMTDRAFRAEFMSAPTAVFTKYSIDMYGDKKIEVHENTKTKMHYALLPEGTDLEDLNVPEEFKQIQKKAWEDKTYLEMLLTDPRNAVTQVMGSVPASLEISFYAYSPDTAHVVLPAFEEDSDELTDDDLEMVAGGKGGRTSRVIKNAFDPTKNTYTKPVVDAVEDFVKDPQKSLENIGRTIFRGW